MSKAAGKLWRSLVVPALLAPALFGCSAFDERKSRTEPTPVASSARPVSGVELDEATRGFAERERYVYDFELSTTIALGPDANAFDFDLGGELSLTAVNVTAQAATLYAEVSKARVATRIPGSEAELDRLAAEIETSHAFLVFEAGRVSELRVPPELSQFATGTFRQLGAALQFVHDKNGADAYTTDEYDVTGKVVTRYERAGERGTWRKRKERYLELLGNQVFLGGGGVRVLPQIKESFGEIRIDATGRPEHVRLADRLVLNGPQNPVRSTVALKLTSKSRTLLDTVANFSELASRDVRYRSDQAIRDADAEDALEEARIGGLDFETISKRLETRVREQERLEAATAAEGDAPAVAPSADQEAGRLFTALGALYRSDPRTVGGAIAKIQARSPASATLVDALGSAGTADAHHALGRLLADKRFDPELRARVVLALARAPRPTKEAILALKGVLDSDPFNAGALYGLGTHARLLKDENAHAAAELGDFLVSRLRGTTGAATLGTVLRAIANSGYDPALPRILPYLRDREERVRASAVRSLQLMRDSRVDQLIAERLAEDASKRVRLSAIEAARLREPNAALSEALARAGVEADDPHVRFRAVELMAKWLPKRAELREVLASIARSDAETRIQERARAAL
jgi:hypothetical protein